MSLLGKIFVKLGLDNSEFKRGMNESKQQTDNFGAYMKKVGGMIVAAFSVTAIWNFAKSVIQSYNAQAVAVAKLESVLKSTNNTVGLTSKELQGYASQLQKVTVFGDEVTMEAMSRLLIYKSVSKDIFKQAIASAQDLATIMGTDLNSAVMQIGKALESPQLGLMMLRRSGIIFSEEQQSQIKKLVAENKLYEAQLIILTELQSKFGGAAKSQAQTSAGVWKQVANVWDDLKEILGSSIENANSLAAILKNLILGVQNLLNGSYKPKRGTIGWYLWGGGTKQRFAIDTTQAEEDARKTMEGITSVAQAETKLKEIRALGAKDIGAYGVALAKMLETYIQENKATQNSTEVRKGKIQTIQDEISVLEQLRVEETDGSALVQINNKIAARQRELEILQMTTAQLKELKRLETKGGKRTAEIGANALGIPAGGRQLYDGLTALYGLGGQQTEADLMVNAKKTMDGVAKKSQEADWANRLAEMLKNSNDQLQIEADRTEQIAGQISNAFSNIIGASVENLSDIISGTSKLDSSQLAAALLMPLADMAIAIGTIILTSGEAIQGLMKALTNPANAGVAVAAGLGLIAVGILAKAGLKALAKNGGQAGQGSTTSFTGGAGGFAPSVSQTKVEVFGKISGNDILLSSTRANIDKRR